MIILEEEYIRADTLADRIRELAGNPALLARRQAAALRTAEELLDYDRIVLQTLAPDRTRVTRP